MKITFVSNYINHHQIPVSDELYGKLGEEYRFIQTQPMEEERVLMGWASKTGDCPYLMKYYEEPEACRELIVNSDIVIFGGVEDESYIEDRLRKGKIVLRYCERLYKEGVWKAVSPRGLLKKYHDHTRYHDDPVYLLCAGGYVAYDFSLIRAYAGKRFRWGYFPETIPYEWSDLTEKKGRAVKENGGKTQILWAARLIECKHPEAVITLARQLKSSDCQFQIRMLGGGELEEEIRARIRQEGLSDVITMLGARSPDEVRKEMESAGIFLFTSDFIEGWGAVLNEAMNGGCAVISSHAAGGASFLIRDGVNGRIYRYGNGNELFELTRELICNPFMQKKLGENAFHTITDLWNAQHAAGVLIKLCENLIMGKKEFEAEGPLSEAEVIPERRMYEELKEHGC